MIKGTGGKFRPQDPPSIFDIPHNVPTPKPVPRPSKKEFLTQSYFDVNYKSVSFSQFDPRIKLRKCDNIVYNADPDKILCAFLSEYQTESQAVIIHLFFFSGIKCTGGQES